MFDQEYQSCNENYFNKDPVCGMEIIHSESGFLFCLDYMTYYFCSASCQKNFIKTPENFIKPKRNSSEKTHDKSHEESVGPDASGLYLPHAPENGSTGAW